MSGLLLKAYLFISQGSQPTGNCRDYPLKTLTLQTLGWQKDMLGLHDQVVSKILIWQHRTTNFFFLILILLYPHSLHNLNKLQRQLVSPGSLLLILRWQPFPLVPNSLCLDCNLIIN